MRLTAIKLAGFKSFVDPTTIKFPSNLMGIVGPNGCGKSNIIDAVRWVMGESSARQLRGESMSDVIFSGSSARKPVTTATVELVFDNADGRAGGEYAKYNEISVRRQVSRDGQSLYFLNGSRCRRKDITDLFLGTGLGPRSYAIIEQGMISQIVEARPEELRGFLEEAAGISLYKERRRETENRIKHTRENLERLADLREEVGKQLAKLNRQAKAAERYRKLKKRYREDEARLTALRWRKARGDVEAQSKALKQTETALEQAVASQREAEKALEQLREKQHNASEHASKVQAELYEVGGEIARLEQAIEHARELRQRQQAEYKETESQLNELKQHLVLDKAQVEQVTQRMAELEPALNAAREQESSARAALDEAETELTRRQEAFTACQQGGAKNRQQVELLKLRIEHLDERMNQAAERLSRMRSDDEGRLEALEQEAQATAEQLAEIENELKAADATLAEARQARDAQRTVIEDLRRQLEADRGRRHEAHGRLQSLKTLNEPDRSDADRERWLAERGLDTAPRVLESLKVDDRWQRAAETVLEHWLSARLIDSALPERLPSGPIGLIDPSVTGAAPGGTLAAVVQGAGALNGVLASVYLADDADAARQKLSSLAPHESVIDPDGTWRGPGWIWRGGQDDAGDGRLARQQEIRALEASLAELDASIERRAAELAEATDQDKRAVEGIEKARAEVDRRRARRAELAGVKAGQDNRREALKKQREQAAQEREALENRQKGDQENVGTVRRELQAALAELETQDAEQQALDKARSEQQGVRERARHAYREARDLREQNALKLESSKASLDSLKQAIQRMDTQIGQLQGRYVELSEALARGDAPEREQAAQRDALLEKRLEVEQRLKAARAELEELEVQWRGHDQTRQKSAAEAEEIRQQQSNHKLRLRELEIEVERFAARIEELGGQLEALVESLPDDAEAQAWVDGLAQLEERIRRMEPVNLAAIEEFEEESKRKDYLDRQHADLTEALDTLESAIARIDKTTRTKYKDTFERVNRNLETLFPRLFGGGHGTLEMVGDDWLTAGAAILARPPGKRVSRIHLLSGGEKALTAVAFVFSIFNLNPAPFCLLDEVDAPLDDANVGRFSELVREMSDKVQFLFVTHNKVTMEVAHQMLGVTMREPGISRLVSVDLEKAVAMAAS
jgi:chromosome segregation protein